MLEVDDSHMAQEYNIGFDDSITICFPRFARPAGFRWFLPGTFWLKSEMLRPKMHSSATTELYTPGALDCKT